MILLSRGSNQCSNLLRLLSYEQTKTKGNFANEKALLKKIMGCENVSQLQKITEPNINNLNMYHLTATLKKLKNIGL